MRSVTAVGALLAATVLFLPRTTLAIPATTADDLCPPAASRCVIGKDVEVAPGAVLDFGARPLEIGPGVRVTTTTAMTIRAATLSVNGGVLGAPGGTIVLEATAGDLSILVNRAGRRQAIGTVDVGAGRVTLAASGRVFIDGVVAANGGAQDGGFIEVEAGTILVTGSLEAESTQGDGGQIYLSSANDTTLAGSVVANGIFGGVLSFLAEGGVTLAGSLSARARSGSGGEGGTLEVEARGPVRLAVTRLLDLRGADGPDGAGEGGSMTVTSDASVTVTGRYDLTTTAGGGAGYIELSAGADLELASGAVLDVSGSGNNGVGGAVSLSSSRRIVLGTINASGEGSSGRIDASAWCDLVVPATAVLRATGPGPVEPEILLAASNSLRIAGRLTSKWGIRLAHRPGGSVIVDPSANVSPAPTLVVDETLVPCGGIPVPPGCGNGRLEAGEGCDDGNTQPCDGCDASCQVEPPVECGNGVVDCGETCDDGNTADCDGCRGDCSRPDAVCGDAIVECDEAADDGNTIPCDGVSDRCTIERCGNGVRECLEACDDGPEGSPVCTPSCEALLPTCGNGVEDPGEQCDDGNTVDCDGCSASCLRERPGNAIVECGETCDDGNTEPCDGCDARGQEERCGNGVLDCGEECDEGEANGSAGSTCLPEICRRGELCTTASAGPCIPCATHQECGPLGLCGGYRCVAGVCDLGAPPSCDDSNACTQDACDPASQACVHTLSPCDDGNACTDDACEAASGCVHRPRSCDDGDACTQDSCDPNGSCVHQRLRGVEGLGCFLGGLQARIAATTPDGLGPKTRKKLLRILRSMEAKRSALAPPDSRKARRAARQIEKLRRKAQAVITRARDVSPTVREALLDLLGPRMPLLP